MKSIVQEEGFCEYIFPLSLGLVHPQCDLQLGEERTLKRRFRIGPPLLIK